MSLPRVLEPEVMDQPDDAADYDAMDHSEVNRSFVLDLLASLSAAAAETSSPPDTSAPNEANAWLDIGTGTAQIPIELCRQHPDCKILAIDLAVSMLDQARYNIEAAGHIERIQLAQVDAKELPYEDAQFPVVMSNSIIHHLEFPESCLREAARVTQPGGLLFVRDLIRPDSEKTLQHLVKTYVGHEAPHARQLFEDSLRAALTLDEVRQRVEPLGGRSDEVSATSDRHWTWVHRKPLND